ncbi:PilN family type IVB pilus formation outer membrane protein [Burkholderia thailandensis]|uniref:PilN family type IVB pilus formation outer membrane protein n=1 Tax=Burkholderia thailandensis TaxID=57975 RepID=UPI0003EC8BE4|nr:PilN family type IVB pilus formation outer membrane protein [Burkholderia thailandensis]AHI66926.1 type IVB pilus formation outer membrane protein, R64 PilN family [Burkholderia thailandensis H0587]AIP66558.1 secretin [Burkholderia thailandensis]AJY32107.1 type IVB pilus formation outer membrane protein, R64 PilN family [Burkholderia thailandensis 34]AOI54418.1 secretin [Burkholderia thailandensis]AOJ53399.1 secretin [Burkholderia thailandensis]
MRVLFAISLLAVAWLAGCTGLRGDIERDARRESNESAALFKRASDGDNSVHALAPVVVDDGLWVSAGAVKLRSGEQLPPLFDEPASFDRAVSSLSEFAEQITRLTQVPTQVAASAQQAAARSQQGGGADGAARSAPVFLDAAGARSTPPLPPGMPGGASAGGGKAGGSGAGPDGGTGTSFAPVRIVYAGGTLRGLLDAACARFGVFWKYEQGTIRFFFTDTRTFQVNAIPGDSSLNASVVSGATSDGTSGGSQSGGSGGGINGASGGTTGLTANNTANTAVNSQLSVFNGLQSAIQSMLSRYGSSVSSPATGSISVTDTPDVLERVAAFMTQQNRSLSRQVLLNVTVLSVSLKAGDAYGIDWSLVYKTMSAGFNITNPFNPVSLTKPADLSATVLSPTSRFNGTKLLIRALSQQGTVRRKTSASVTTLNNQPVPVQVATQTGYLASVSTTNTANVGSSTALTPGVVTTGFNMTLLPHVLDDGTVMLQFSTNISSLLQLKEVSSSTGGRSAARIQTPDVDMRNFLQRVAMKSGETLVISGYEGANDSLDERGVGTPKMIALGGGYEAQRAREVIVILITPVTQRGGA